MPGLAAVLACEKKDCEAESEGVHKRRTAGELTLIMLNKQ
jgi:hypothetical protein